MSTETPTVVTINGRLYMTLPHYAKLIGRTSQSINSRCLKYPHVWPSTRLGKTHMVDLLGWLASPRMTRPERYYVLEHLPFLRDELAKELANEVK